MNVKEKLRKSSRLKASNALYNHKGNHFAIRHITGTTGKTKLDLWIVVMHLFLQFSCHFKIIFKNTDTTTWTYSYGPVTAPQKRPVLVKVLILKIHWLQNKSAFAYKYLKMGCSPRNKIMLLLHKFGKMFSQYHPPAIFLHLSSNPWSHDVSPT